MEAVSVITMAPRRASLMGGFGFILTSDSLGMSRYVGARIRNELKIKPDRININCQKNVENNRAMGCSNN